MKKSGLKKWIAAAMALVMSVSVFGCGTANTPGTTENNSVDESKIVVAKVGDYEITKAEFREEFEYARQAQTRQTMQDPVVDAETLVTFQNEILEGLTVKYMELYQMKQQGFDTLTEAEEAEIQEKLDANREALEAAQRGGLLFGDDHRQKRRTASGSGAALRSGARP